MMTRGAIISECGQFRYHLLRRWAEGPTLVFVMLNPSTADADIDDPTIRRCIGLGQTLGFGGIEVINLYAYRATKPADLKAAGYPVGADNDDMLARVAAGALLDGCVVCAAWGAGAAGLSRPLVVQRFFADAGVVLQCLEKTASGHPVHPLYLPGATHLRAYPNQAAPAGGQPEALSPDAKK